MLLGGEPGAGKSAALSLLVATAALDPSCGCGCWTASWSSCRRGRRARSGSPARTSTRRSRCCGTVRAEMEDRYRELLARGSAQDHPRRRPGAAPGRLRRARVLPRRRGPQATRRVRRAAARPGRTRPRCRRDRVRGDPEAGRRRRPLRVAGSVRVPARAALQHAAGVGHDPRPGLGQLRATAPPRSRPGQRGVGYLLAEDGLPVRMRGFYLPDEQITSDRRARRRCARRRLARWWRSGASVMSARERAKANANALRANGLTIARIADRLGVPRATVGGWLRGRGEWYEVRECALCGERFIAASGRQRFCTRKHAAKHRRVFGPPTARERIRERARASSRPSSPPCAPSSTREPSTPIASARGSSRPSSPTCAANSTRERSTRTVNGRGSLRPNSSRSAAGSTCGTAA